MYGGPAETVVLSFDPSLVGVVYDRFGEDIQMETGKDGRITARIRVQISPTFWGWLFQFADMMWVLSPPEGKRAYEDRAPLVLASSGNDRSGATP